MGLVLKAYDPELDRPVAIKLLHSHRVASEAARTRLQREAKALGRLSHPNVVTIFERGEVDGRPYVVMEFVQGTSLREVMRRGPVPASEALVIVRGVSSGIERAAGPFPSTTSMRKSSIAG